MKNFKSTMLFCISIIALFGIYVLSIHLGTLSEKLVPVVSFGETAGRTIASLGIMAFVVTILFVAYQKYVLRAVNANSMLLMLAAPILIIVLGASCIVFCRNDGYIAEIFGFSTIMCTLIIFCSIACMTGYSSSSSD